MHLPYTLNSVAVTKGLQGGLSRVGNQVAEICDYSLIFKQHLTATLVTVVIINVLIQSSHLNGALISCINGLDDGGLTTVNSHFVFLY